MEKHEWAALLVVGGMIIGTFVIGFGFGAKYGEAKSAGVSVGRLHIDNFSIDASWGDNGVFELFLDDFVLENVIVALGGLER